MRQLINKLFDAAYIIVIGGIIGGTIFSLLFRLDGRFPDYHSLAPNEVRLGIVLISIVSMAYALGRFMPLMAVTAENLLYKERTLQVRTGLSAMSALQLLPLVAFAALSAPPGMKLLCAALALVVQLLVGIRPWKLPRLLKAGSARALAATLIYVQDSELISGSLAQSQMKNLKPRGPLKHPSGIILRRVLRRWYLPFFAVCIPLWAMSLSYISPVGAAVFLFIGHALCFAGVLRIMDLGEYYTVPLAVKAVSTVALCLVSVAIFCVVVGMSPWTVNTALFFIAIMSASALRSRPRVGDGTDMFETDFGFFSLSLFNYFTEGFWISTALVIAALLV